MNGNFPADPPTFMSANVRKVLRLAGGAKLSAREITIRLGQSPGTIGEPSGFMMNVIRILAQYAERGEALTEMPTAARPEIAYWIEPPKDDAR
ncbi:MAG: hypothetical protein ACREHF_01960 [Rhizomicrobium sp.]